MKVVILAGGRGERLRPLTDKAPKPLLMVGKKPFIFHLVENLRRRGFTEQTILAGYLGDKIFEAFLSENPNISWDVKIESRPLGTAGALKLIENEFKDERFIVMNGDTWFDFNLWKLIEEHKKNEYLITVAEVNGVDSGVAVIEREALELIKEGDSLNKDLYPLLEEWKMLKRVEVDGEFFDIGDSLKAYKKFREWKDVIIK